MDSLGFQVVLAGDPLGDGMSTLPSLVAASLAYPHLRVGTYVIDNDYRHLAVLAMEAATVDQLTGGYSTGVSRMTGISRSVFCS